MDSSSEDSSSEIDTGKAYHGIYVSADNKRIEDITLSLDDLSSLLECKVTDARSITTTRMRNGKQHTYSLIIFFDDMGAHRNLPINHEATTLTGTQIHGPIVIIDEHVDLNQSDLL